MTTLRGAIRPRTTPDETPGESTPITADGPDYDTDPTALLAELNEMARGHAEILAEQAGGWVGY